ncbi:cobalamin biosynthesis protein, partial [Deltaproteobacteria bacterium OttesenSCG-928-M10]|nr:cobalamin biosynthesis protein [Deltaproteobacteria bacterium OttesenSCG-928-M10]
PQRWPHPVRFIGRLIRACEVRARRMVGENALGLRRAGVLMALLVVLSTMSAAWLLLFATSAIGRPVHRSGPA